MKLITTTPKKPKIQINMPKKPSFGIKVIRAKGIISPLRFPK